MLIRSAISVKVRVFVFSLMRAPGAWTVLTEVRQSAWLPPRALRQAVVSQLGIQAADIASVMFQEADAEAGSGWLRVKKALLTHHGLSNCKHLQREVSDLCQRLVEIGQDVIYMFDTDR